MSFQLIPESYGESLALLEIGSSFQNETEEEKIHWKCLISFKISSSTPPPKILRNFYSSHVFGEEVSFFSFHITYPKCPTIKKIHPSNPVKSTAHYKDKKKILFRISIQD